MPDRDDMKKSSAAADVAARETQKDVGQDMQQAKATAAEGLESAKREVADQAAAIGEEARRQAHAVGEEARSYMSRQKDLAAEQIEDVAGAVRKAAEEMENPTFAGYARDLAGGLTQLSENMRSRSLDQMVASAADFGRRQPVAFLGAAALMGFAASRFVKASADRHSHAEMDRASQPLTDGEYATEGISPAGYGDGQTAGTSMGASYGERR